MPETNLKNGDVSVYGFYCGYVQKKECGPVVEIKNPFGKFSKVSRFTVRLYGDGVYHIQVTDWKLFFGLEAWETYDTLKEARAAYKRAVKFYSKQDDTYRIQERNMFGEDPLEWA